MHPRDAMSKTGMKLIVEALNDTDHEVEFGYRVNNLFYVADGFEPEAFVGKTLIVTELPRVHLVWFEVDPADGEKIATDCGVIETNERAEDERKKLIAYNPDSRGDVLFVAALPNDNGKLRNYDIVTAAEADALYSRIRVE